MLAGFIPSCCIIAAKSLEAVSRHDDTTKLPELSFAPEGIRQYISIQTLSL